MTVKQKAKQVARLLREERPDYFYLKELFRHLRTELKVVVEQKPSQADKRQWVFYFIMPSSYRMDTLPKPNNPQIQIKEVPAKKMAVISFSGLVDDEKLASRTEDLNAWLKTQNINPNGAPQLARYNPPWILPWWRRNEVMIPVQ